MEAQLIEWVKHFDGNAETLSEIRKKAEKEGAVVKKEGGDEDAKSKKKKVIKPKILKKK